MDSPRILNETTTILLEKSFVSRLYAGFKTVIDKELFRKLVSLDPGTDLEKDIAGENAHWLVTKYRKDDPDIIAAVDNIKKAKEVTNTLSEFYQIADTKKETKNGVFLLFLGMEEKSIPLKTLHGKYFVFGTDVNKYFIWFSINGETAELLHEPNEVVVKVDLNEAEVKERIDFYITKKMVDNLKSNPTLAKDVIVSRNGSMVILQTASRNGIISYDEDNSADLDKAKVKIGTKVIEVPIERTLDDKLSFQKLKEKLASYQGGEELSIKTDPNYKGKIPPSEYTVIYQDSRWVVLYPKTKSASFALAGGANWCTSDPDNTRTGFDKYNANGHLYVIVDKTKKEDQEGRYGAPPEGTEKRYQFFLGKLNLVNSDEDDSLTAPQFKTYKINGWYPIDGENPPSPHHPLDRGGFEMFANKEHFSFAAMDAIDQDSGGKLTGYLKQNADVSIAEAVNTITEGGHKQAVELYFKYRLYKGLDVEDMFNADNAMAIFNFASSPEMRQENPKLAQQLVDRILDNYGGVLFEKAFAISDSKTKIEAIKRLIGYGLDLSKEVKLLSTGTNLKTAMQCVGLNKEEVDAFFGRFDKNTLIKIFNSAKGLEGMVPKGLQFFLDQGINPDELTMVGMPIEQYYTTKRNQPMLDMIAKYKKPVAAPKKPNLPPIKPKKPTEPKGKFK